MSQIPNLSFDVRFEPHNPNRVGLIDTTPSLPDGYIGIFKVTQPDGYVRSGDINNPDVNNVTRSVSVTIMPDAAGQIQQGQYTIELTALAPGYLSTVFTRTFTFQYNPASVVLRNDFDLFTPSLAYTDISNYNVSGYNISSGPERKWDVTSPTTGLISGTNSSIDLVYNGNYYAENYSIAFRVNIAYASQAYAWLGITHTINATAAVTACIPKSIEELTQAVDALRIESNQACGDDWSRFEKANALYTHLINMLRLVLVAGEYQEGFYDVYQQLLSLLQNGNTTCSTIGQIIPPYDFSDYESSIYDGEASYCTLVGNGVDTVYTINHQLGDKCVVAQVYEVATGKQVICDLAVVTINTIDLTFFEPPTTNQYRVVVVAGAIGIRGQGLQPGGLDGQVLVKKSDADFDTEWADASFVNPLLVPYVNALFNVNLGEFGLTGGYLGLDTTPTGTPALPGTIAWNDSDGTADLRLKGGNVMLQIGQEMVARVVNKTGANLLESQYRAVRIRKVSEGGAQGQRLAVVLAQANNELGSTDMIGIVTESISDNQEGFITTFGTVRGIDTTGTLQGEVWADGDILFLSPTVPGGLTKVKPSAPNHLVIMGYVEYAHQNNGKIFVHVQTSWELEELHNVKIATPAAGQTLVYNSVNGLWENRELSLNELSDVAVSAPATGQVLTYNGAGWNNAALPASVTSVGLASATPGITITNTPVTGSGVININIATASGSTNGLLSSADWTVFNGKQAFITPGTTGQYYRGDKTFQNLDTSVVPESTNLYFTDSRARQAISLTTIGSSGAATYDNSTGIINVPQYTLGSLGGVPSTRTLTINGTAYDLSADRSWSVGTVTSVNMSVPTGFAIGGNPVTSSGTLALSFAAGYSLPTDASQANWNTAYTNRITSLTTTGTSGAATLVSNVLNIPQYQAQGNYITSLTGEATASGPGAASVTLSNSAVTGKVLTGLTVTGTTIAATDSILTAFGKVQGQINSLMGGLKYQGTWNASTNTPTLASATGTEGYFYIVNVAGTTSIDGINDWKVGDWIVYNGGAWQKVDNTDSVVSVNGATGAVVLTTTNISEGTNLYYTNARARLALSLTTTGSSGAATYDNITGVFNIPQYTLAGLGGVPTTRQLTINGTAFDLSADRSWSVGTVTSVAALTIGSSGTDVNSSVSNGTTTPVITLNIPSASTTARGLVTTSAQTFGGEKTFYSNATILDTAGASSQLQGRAGGTLYGGIFFGPFYQFNAYAAATEGYVWKNAATDNVMTLTQTGAFSLKTLVGTGTRMVVTDANGLVSTQAIPSGTTTGSGTTNYIPKWTSASALGNSSIFDNGNVGIGTTNPQTYLVISNAGNNGFEFDPVNNFFSSVNRATSAWTQTKFRAGSFLFNLNNSNNAVSILSNGNTLIGTETDSGYKLDVVGTLRSTLGANFATTSGNVGVGTISPSFALDVQTASARVRVKPSTTTNYALFQAENAGNIAYLGIDDSTGGLSGTAYALNVYHNGAYPIVFSTSGVNRMWVSSGGNVGIGTSTPSSKLQVVGGVTAQSALLSSTMSNGDAIAWFDNNNTTTDQSFGLLIDAGTSANDYALRVRNAAASELFRITGAGNVGISNGSPGSKLTISTGGTGTTANGIRLDNGAQQHFWYLEDNTTSHYNIGSTGGQWKWSNSSGNLMILNSSGNVGIGAASPATKLTIGTGQPLFLSSGSSSTIPFLAVLNNATPASANYGWEFYDSATTGNLEIFRRNASTTGVATLVLSRSTGSITAASLAGTGTRMVVADSSGVLSTQSISGGVVLGSGTTNYVPRWTPNGTTLGNSQIFDDGTNIGIGTTAPGQKLTISGGNVEITSVAWLRYTPAGGYFGSGTVLSGLSTDLAIRSDNALLFGTNGANERLRIFANGRVGINTGATDQGSNLQVIGSLYNSASAVLAASSGNVFIGATTAAISTGYKYAYIEGGLAGIGPELVLHNTVANDIAEMAISFTGVRSGAGVASQIKSTRRGVLTFHTQDLPSATPSTPVERMRIDNNGSVGINNVPPAWGGNFNALQVTSAASLASNGGNLNLGFNYYWNGSASIYNNSGFASLYQQSAGEHRWSVAPSGTAGGTISFTRAMTLTNIGRLGVGIANPDTKLHVSGGDLYVDNFGAANDANYTNLGLRAGTDATLGPLYLLFQLRPSATGTNRRVEIFSGDNIGYRNITFPFASVGIGVTNPQSKLHIVQAGAAEGFRVDGASGAFGLVVNGGNTNTTKINAGLTVGVNYFATTPPTNGALFEGNVGIGTTSPNQKLEVSGTTRISTTVGSTLGFLQFDHPGAQTWKFGVFSDNTSTLSIGNDLGGTFGSRYLNITNTGNVGIGTTSPGARLVVRTAANDAPGLGNSGGHFQLSNGEYGLVAGVGGSGNVYMQAQRTDGTATAYNINLQPSGGNINIGTTTATNFRLNVVTPAVSGRQNMAAIDRTAQNFVTFTNPQYAVDASMGILLRVFPQSDARQGAGIIASGGGNNGDTNLDLFVSQGTTTSTSYSAIRLEGATGNVGIGTTSLTERFQVSGGNAIITGASGTSVGLNLQPNTTNADARTWGLIASSQSFGDFDIRQSNAKDGNPSSAGTSRLYLSRLGNVGIGTTNPGSATLRVQGIGSDAVQSALQLSYNTSMTSGVNGVYMSFNNSSEPNSQLARIAAFYEGGTYRGSLRFYTNTNADGGSPTEQMRIFANGNVFVGPTPTDSGYRLDVNGTFNVRSNYAYFGGDANTAVYAGSFSNEGRIGVGGRSSFPTAALTFYTADGTNNFERMRIFSNGNVAIGTTTDASYKLDVNGNSRVTGKIDVTANTEYAMNLIRSGTSAVAFQAFNSNAWIIMGAESSSGGGLFTGSSANAAVVGSGYNTPLQFATNNIVRMTVDNVGNVGVGVIPSAWTWRALQVGTAALASTSTVGFLSANAYFDGAYKYTTTGTAQVLEVNNGNEFRFLTAGSGTAGSAVTFTQAMTVFSNGNVSVGNSTNAGYKFDVFGGNARVYGSGLFVEQGSGFQTAIALNQVGVRQWVIRNVATSALFAINDGSFDRLVINGSTGNVGIGTTSPDYALEVERAGVSDIVSNSTVDSNSAIVSTYNSSATSLNFMQMRSYGNSTGATLFGASTNKMNALFSNADSVMAMGTISATPVILGTNNAERIRITSSGEVLVGTTTDIGDYKLQVNGGIYTNYQMKVAAAQLSIEGHSNAAALYIASHSVTGSSTQPVIQADVTLNTTGDVNLLNYSITNTASGANTNWLRMSDGTNTFRVTKNAAVVTAAPTGGSAKPWKLGAVVATTVTLNTGNFVEVEIDGTFYRLAIVNPA